MYLALYETRMKFNDKNLKLETKLIDVQINYNFLLVHYSFWKSETSYPMIIKLYNR